MGDPGPPHDRRLDASRRTHLANERTYLAWLRSGLTSLAVGLGVAKFLPDFGGGPVWPYIGLGSGFCILGILMILIGVRRLREVSRALGQGDFGPLNERIALQVGSLAIVLAVLTIAVIVFDR